MLKSHVFRGSIRYRIFKDLSLDPELDGLCHHMTKTIHLAPALSGLRELETLIHEAEHAEYPDCSEYEVLVHSRNMASLLWKYGYRLTGEGCGKPVKSRKDI